ncbi:MAG: hypothetical protein ACM33T_02875 [Solirubrobacterales bacterium]
MRRLPLALIMATMAGCSPAAQLAGRPPAARPPAAEVVPAKGTLAGGLLGRGLAAEDRAAAASAERAALDEGRDIGWSGSGVEGLVRPTAAWLADGTPCRSYTHRVSSAGLAREWRAKACRDGLGQWRIIR